MEKIEKGEIFINENNKKKKVELTIVMIYESESHMKNIHIVIIKEHEIKNKRIVTYVNVYNDNKIQCNNNMKYLFISNKKTLMI